MKIIFFGKNPRGRLYTLSSLLIFVMILSVNIFYFSGLSTSMNAFNRANEYHKLSIILDGPGQVQTAKYLSPTQIHVNQTIAQNTDSIEVLKQVPKEDLFINTEGRTTEYIVSQLEEAADMADLKGSSIVLLNVGVLDSERAARAIVEIFPKLESRNLRLVYMSEM